MRYFLKVMLDLDMNYNISAVDQKKTLRQYMLPNLLNSQREI